MIEAMSIEPDSPQFERVPAGKGIRSDLDAWMRTLQSSDTSDLPSHPSFLFFRHVGIEMAIAASDVASVEAIGFTHRVPHRTDKIFRGLAASNGELIPLVMLEGLLQLPESKCSQDRVPRLVVMESLNGGGRWSMVVDVVHGVDMSDADTWESCEKTIASVIGMIPTRHGASRLLDSAELCRLASEVLQ